MRDILSEIKKEKVPEEVKRLLRFLCKVAEDKDLYKKFYNVLYNPNGIDESKILELKNNIIKEYNLLPDHFTLLQNEDVDALRKVIGTVAVIVFIFCSPVPFRDM
jgi:hypothetical protein